MKRGFSGEDSEEVGRKAVERMLAEAREEADRGKRLEIFLEAMQRATVCGAADLERDALSLAVLFSIGGGDPRSLVRMFWGEFKDLEERVFRCRAGRERDRYLWAGERVLYYAPEFPEVPLPELERALDEWLRAVRAVGGYERKLELRLQLHHSLRLERLDKAESLMRALEAAEPESDFAPRAGLLPGEELESGGGGNGRTDFGCGAYANQVRVLYYCARGEAQRAWRCARHFVEGRSACGLSLCAVAPREALAALLEPLDRAGLHEEARIVHRLGLPMVRGVAGVEGWFGHHLRHLVRRGSALEGLELLESVDLQGRSPSACSPFQRFHFLRGVLAVCRAIPAKAPERVADAEEVAGLARKFDARNGGDAFARMLWRDGA
jgi:hypothetical protein